MCGCSSYGSGTLEGLSDSWYHCTAKGHMDMVADMASSPVQACAGAQLPSQEGGDMDRENDACSMRSMDPCSDLLLDT